LNTGTMPVPDIIEWIAEWARDTRGQQRGLLLLTAHRAKGLEFDHVVILNGDWRNPSRNEDPDAPRRLFYVAMTRARQSLTVLTQGMHHLLDVEAPSVLRRKVAVEATHDLPAADIYVLPSLRLVDLSFAGRKHVSQHSLAAIRDAKVGDPLTLEQRDGKWVLIDAGGRLLGRMVNAWQPPPGHAFDKGQVGAIINWRKVDNKEEFHGTLSRDSWETVLPELIFRPLRELGRNGLPVSEHKAPEPKTQPFFSNAAVAKSTEDAVPDALPDDLALVETIIRDAISAASSWEALAANLERKDITLIPKSGGLVVSDTKSGADICKLSAIGFRYLELIKRFGEGFPGHPATWLVERALSDGYTAKAQSKPRKGRRNRRTGRGGDDITLVED